MLPFGSAKLALWCHGPFKITKVVSPIAYKLELLLHWKIHPVFHALLLISYTETDEHGPNFMQSPPNIIDGQEKYEVKKILVHRYHRQGQKLQYLVKWWGYLDSNNTWEPKENLHADNLIQEYEQRIQHIRTMIEGLSLMQQMIALIKRHRILGWKKW